MHKTISNIHTPSSLPKGPGPKIFPANPELAADAPGSAAPAEERDNDE